MTGDFIRRWSQALACAAMLVCTPAAAQDAQQEWDGWYGGGLLGNAWTDIEIVTGSTQMTGSYSGVTGGLVGGFNVVNNQFLFGFEADITLFDLGGDTALHKHKVSLVGRAGTFISPDTLLFGVAGLAGGQYRAKFMTTSTMTTVMTVGDDEVMVPVTTTTTLEGEANKRLWGYTVGGGIEHNVGGVEIPILIGVEYRYTDFQSWDFVLANQAFSVEPEVQEVRARVIFPF